ncbi:MAG: general stress protein CsbD [Gammaproteobacteria bacterium BRH_c0]|nr:MAG: general stress protein CsbD [Gammaproteobacteria bacterium BRH_c0]
MNKDQVKGRITKTEGQVKEAAGKAVGNESLEIKGKIKKAAGTVQAAFGDLKSDLKKDRS